MGLVIVLLCDYLCVSIDSLIPRERRANKPLGAIWSQRQRRLKISWTIPTYPNTELIKERRWPSSLTKCPTNPGRHLGQW
jgi:hypothetical protein